MDDTVMVREKQRAMRTHVSKMSALFHDADTSGDGRLDIEECLDLSSCCNDELPSASNPSPS